jgi:hypothetical protein
MRSSKKFLRKLVFLALLKNCENLVALLHYNNQAAAAVDYIMFNFDNFSISMDKTGRGRREREGEPNFSRQTAANRFFFNKKS